MSQTTFSRSSTPDTPTASVLTVTRNDTAAIVIGPNQSMTLVGSVWSYGPFTDPAAGITYTVSMTWTYADATIGSTIYITPPTGNATGYYASQSDLEARYGSTNIADWSVLDGIAGANTARIQAELYYADSVINSFFTDSPFNVPLTLQPNSAFLVRRWAVVIASESLYRNRGQQTTGEAQNQYAIELAATMNEMGLYKGGILRLSAARRWPSPNSPVGVW